MKFDINTANIIAYKLEEFTAVSIEIVLNIQNICIKYLNHRCKIFELNYFLLGT